MIYSRVLVYCYYYHWTTKPTNYYTLTLPGTIYNINAYDAYIIIYINTIYISYMYKPSIIKSHMYNI